MVVVDARSDVVCTVDSSEWAGRCEVDELEPPPEPDAVRAERRVSVEDRRRRMSLGTEESVEAPNDRFLVERPPTNESVCEWSDLEKLNFGGGDGGCCIVEVSSSWSTLGGGEGGGGPA